MNERFESLAEEAMVLVTGAKGLQTHTFSLEKFAESIVRECAGLVQGVPTDTMGYHTADQKIKEHFGVEE